MAERRGWIHRGLSVAGVVLAVIGLGQVLGPSQAAGEQLFFRVVGSQNNAPLLPKTRSVCAPCGGQRVGSTGMADAGFTEFPFCRGYVDFGFLEDHAIYPRLVSHAAIVPGRVNTADIVMDHVYQPDGCVWGYTGREFVQTFTVDRDTELVSVTLLVASAPDTFCVQLHAGGPGGPGGRRLGRWLRFDRGIAWSTGRRDGCRVGHRWLRGGPMRFGSGVCRANRGRRTCIRWGTPTGMVT